MNNINFLYPIYIFRFVDVVIDKKINSFKYTEYIYLLISAPSFPFIVSFWNDTIQSSVLINYKSHIFENIIHSVSYGLKLLNMT